MPEIAYGDMIHRLEQRHAELIDALDLLDHQLEQTLSSFAKENHDEASLTTTD